MPQPWSLTAQGVVLQVYIQPRATRDRLVGLHGESLKIALMAPAIKNAANTALVAFLAELLQVPRSAVFLVAGAKSREKRLHIRTTDPTGISHRLAQRLAWVDKKKPDG